VKVTSTGLVLAPALLRILATFIDGAILTVIGLAATELFGFKIENDRFEDPGALATLMVLGAAYHISFLSWRSATPGKMAMNVYVAYPDGTPIRPDTAILRYLAWLIGGLLLVGTIVSAVLLFADPRRRTIHDRVAGTMVYAGRAGAPLKPEGPTTPVG
jgi:uncharacterized RDD family membrane protein YckC